MNQINKSIRDNYSMYMSLLRCDKTTEQEIVALSNGRGSHKRYRNARIDITYSIGRVGYISIRQSKSLLIDYGFQVFAEGFPVPIFRFDADGATHYNMDNENLTLLEREIKTPHFHQFDATGKEIAFRTTALADFEFEVQNDINSGLSCFCEQFDIHCMSSKKIVVVEQTELFPTEVFDDVHKGVIFP